MIRKITAILIALSIVLAMVPLNCVYAISHALDYEMRDKVIEFTLSDGTLYYTNTIRYPYFKGNSSVERSINQRYAELIQACEENDTDFQSEYDEMIKSGHTPKLPFFEDFIVESVFNQRGALSIKEVYQFWTGGAHVYRYETGLNYDLSTQQALSCTDILNGTNDQIISVLAPLLEEAFGSDIDYRIPQLMTATPFTLTEEGLCFYYNVGDAVPRLEITVPYTASDTYVIDVEKLVNSAPQPTNPTVQTDSVINAINSLLVGIDYCPAESDVSKWSDEAITSVIYAKLKEPPYKYDEESYLKKLGITRTYSNHYCHIDLEPVQRLVKEAFGLEFPLDVYQDRIFVSGNKLVLSEAIGESETLSVQNYHQIGDTIVAVGAAVHNYNGYSDFQGYFQAVLKECPDSVYGYQLKSIEPIEANQSLDHLAADASSVLVEPTVVHGAENVLDGNLSTVWSEGVEGVGRNEWIKIQTQDGSKMHICAIDFALGYQKSPQHQSKNGWPVDILIECEGNYTQKLEFYAPNDCQLLDVPVSTSWIKFTILDAKPGSHYKDTCISEIRLLGVEPEPYFEKYLQEHPDAGKSGNGLAVFSDYTNLSIRKGSDITFRAGIMEDGALTADSSGISFHVEDTSILQVSDTGTKDNSRYVKLVGLAAGTTTVIFTDSATGHFVSVPVTVYENSYLSYTLSSVPTLNIEKYPTNIYNSNGLYMDSYQFSVRDDQSAVVSFDIYNSNYSYCAVEVFDENGVLQNVVLVDKMTSGITSIKTAVWDNVNYMVRDIWQGDLITYRQESGFSKKTSVTVEIPKNGYLRISTDPEKSAVVGLVNYADLLLSLLEMSGEIKDFDMNSMEFSEKLTAKIVNDKLFAELVSDSGKYTGNLWKNIAKESLLSSQTMGNFIDTAIKNLNELDLSSVIMETASECGWSLGEKVFTDLSGPFGVALEVMFAFGKAENIVIQHHDLTQSAGVGSIYIQNQGGGFRACQQIRVESDDPFSSDTALQTYTVTLDSALLETIRNANPDIYSTIINGTTHTYNISLIKDGMETQPNGNVTVYIPIPENLKPFIYGGDITQKMIKLYRVEANGNLAEMDVETKGDCFVFVTDHFSLYTIVGCRSEAQTTPETNKMQKVKPVNYPASENGGSVTGIIIGVTVAFVVIVGIGAVILIKKKRPK